MTPFLPSVAAAVLPALPVRPQRQELELGRLHTRRWGLVRPMQHARERQADDEAGKRLPARHALFLWCVSSHKGHVLVPSAHACAAFAPWRWEPL
jgi:hypothetical protein